MSVIELDRPRRWLEPPRGVSQDRTLTMDNSKTCGKCRQTLPLSFFSPNPAGRSGLRSNCKSCRAEYTRQWSNANRKRKSATDKKYRDENKDRIRETQKNYRELNKEAISVKRQLWAEKNREKVRNIKKAWEQRNPNSRRLKLLRYRARQANNSILFISKKDLKRLYRSTCFFCKSKNNIEADHIIPIARGGRHSVGNLMPLCRSCNASKSDKFIMEFKLWKERKEQIAKDNCVD